MARIAISNLKKRFGEAYAVDGVDLVVADGEVVALLGPSGCGKTTTLQLLAGFLKPDEGEIRVGERVLSSPAGVVPPERRNMSLIFQSYAVWPHKTVFENVAYGLEVRKVARDEIRRRVRATLETVHLENLAGRYPSELSGGQQQRVALARAVVVEPETLLLDEPLSNLDANLREAMRFEIRRLHEATGITMVYVTHDQAEAMVTADRIAIMHRGTIDQVGTPHEIYEEPRTAFAASFIGRMNVLGGTPQGPDALACGPLVVRALAGGMGGGAAAAGARNSAVVVCIRPQHVLLAPASGDSAQATNRATGRVVRQTYLGDFRDYLVDIGGGIQVRAVTDPAQRHDVGAEVVVELPPERCRMVQA